MTKLEYKIGNLLDVTKGHIVHGCNAQGVMGSGVAAAIKDKYPAVFEGYRQQYEELGLVLGDARGFVVGDGLVVWNAITQQNYGNPEDKRHVSYDAIAECFEIINRDAAVIEKMLNVEPHIHIPLIGAGLGGGKWEIIEKIIEETVTIPVTVWKLN